MNNYINHDISCCKQNPNINIVGIKVARGSDFKQANHNKITDDIARIITTIITIKMAPIKLLLSKW